MPALPRLLTVPAAVPNIGFIPMQRPHPFRFAFSLIEVLFALFIVSIALMAQISSMGVGIRHTASLADHLRAQILLENSLNARILGQNPDPILPGTTEKQVRFYGKSWRIVHTVHTTDLPQVFKLAGEIYPEGQARFIAAERYVTILPNPQEHNR